MSEKGKGGKSLVPRNDTLKGGKSEKSFKSVGTPNPVTGHTNNKAWSKTGHGEDSNKNVGIVILRGVEKEG